MFQEIVVYVIGIITVFLIIKNLFFKGKKKGKKHCGVSDCDIH
jgi:hypothetical protein